CANGYGSSPTFDYW
nr:immunoglobulin heavy chain junction region [Mus musculus]